MDQHKGTTTHTCFACGCEKAESYMQPFGFDEHLGVVSWVCQVCGPRERAVLSGQPAKVIIPGRAALSFQTLTLADQLVREGYGWTADDVMRKALQAYQRLGGKEVQA